MKGMYTYEYLRPSVTADCVIFGFDSEGLAVLLIERGIEPVGFELLPEVFTMPQLQNLYESVLQGRLSI